MSEESQDDSSKTEEPSQKKLDDAKKKGQIAHSREFNHFFMLLGMTFIIMVLSPAMTRDSLYLLSPFLTRPDSIEINAGAVGDLFKDILMGSFIIMLLPIIVLLICVFAPSVVQKKWAVSTESIKPKLEKISPIKGFGRIFSGKTFIEFIKNLIKMIVVGAIVWKTAHSFFDYFDSLPDQSPLRGLEFTETVSAKLLIGVCILLFLLSIGDYFVQRFIFLKSLRMTKQEVKDEYKQQEGDPHIKARLKQLRHEKARKRMMAEVPKADVVITNPTHFAVALKYDATSMQAPKVIAKGADAVAAKIREIAAKHRIPIMRNPPLARVLYDTTDLDEDIPFEHYQAVAKIIGYVYKMKGKTAQAARPTTSSSDKKPQKLEIRKPPKG